MCSFGEGAMLWFVDGGTVQDRTPGRYIANSSDKERVNNHVAPVNCRRAIRRFCECSSVR